MASPVGIERPNCLSLNTSKSKSRVTFKEQVDSIASYCRQTSLPSRKYHSESELKCKRKRSQSCSFSFDNLSSKRRRATGSIVLPTKFLLGGNITDPLNLEALDKGDIEEANESNGSGFRRRSKVQVIIPPNINDPLNLDACSDEGNEQLADAISRQRRRRKTRKRKRRNSEPVSMTHEKIDDGRLSTSLEEPAYTCSRRSPNLPEAFSSEDDAAAAPPISVVTTRKEFNSYNRPISDIVPRKSSDTNVVITQENPSVNIETTHTTQVLLSPVRQPAPKKQRSKSEDKIVSPVIPQPGVERKRHSSFTKQHSLEKSSSSSSSIVSNSSRPASECRPKNACFQYGNYNQYYGYRNMNSKQDCRLKVMEQEWFTGKQVLDIGCNIGHITLSIGKEFFPQRIVGIDIDKKLVNIAQKNIKHYLKGSPDRDAINFPDSMKILYGPLKAPLSRKGHKKFPYNVKFYQTNYVLENDALLETVRPEFDVIMCLSVTKWIHLNFGDDGLVRFFKRIHRNLHPGGMLILEPQAWPSYKKKKKLTPEIYENFKNIKLFPNKFGDLLTNQIGFQFCSKRSVVHFSKGFDRPIYIYRKASEAVDRDYVALTSSSQHTVGFSRKHETEARQNISSDSTEQVVPVPHSEVSTGSSTTLMPRVEHIEKVIGNETEPPSLLSDSCTSEQGVKSKDLICDQLGKESVDSSTSEQRVKREDLICDRIEKESFGFCTAEQQVERENLMCEQLGKDVSKSSETLLCSSLQNECKPDVR